MQVEMSLAELLINAIAHGNVPGVQFKRGWSNDRATFDGLNVVIGSRLDSARSAAIEEAIHRIHDEYPPFKMRAALQAIMKETTEPAIRALAAKGLGEEPR